MKELILSLPDLNLPFSSSSVHLPAHPGAYLQFVLNGMNLFSDLSSVLFVNSQIKNMHKEEPRWLKAPP
jgi:hypothetical protein